MKSSDLYIAFEPRFTNPLASWAFSIISNFSGKIVTVYFKTKKSDLTATRRMVCVYTKTFFTKRAWNPFEKQILNVWDVEKAAYRFISMDSVEKVVAGGDTFTFESDPVDPVNDYAEQLAEQYESTQGLSRETIARIKSAKETIHELFY